MSQKRTTTLAYSVVGESQLSTELGQAIRVSLNTHLLDENGYTLGVVSGSDFTLDLKDAQAMLEALKKAIKNAKKTEQLKLEKVIERVNSIEVSKSF